MVLTLITTIVLAGLVTYQIRQHGAWADRGIHPIVGWVPVGVAQVVAAITAAALIAPAWGTPAGVAAAAFAWVSVLSVATDLATRKIPWDVFSPVAVIGVVAFAFSYTLEGALSGGAALLAVVGAPWLCRVITNKGMGMSDLRLLFAATTTTSWWIGQTWLMYALVVAAIGHLALRIIAPLLRIGTLVPVPGTEDDQTPRLRLELPFAPALVASIWALVGYATHIGYGACQMWNPFGCTP